MKNVLKLLLCWVAFAAQCAEPLWTENFDSGTAVPSQMRSRAPARGGVAHVAVTPGAATSNALFTLPIPLEACRGQRVFFGADVKTAYVSTKPNSWNGVKVMLVVSTASGKSYPQADIPIGTADWKRFSTWNAVPADATNLTLVFGLENVSGEAWFDNASITLKPGFKSTRKVDPQSPIFTGHTVPRLRGAMAGTTLTEEDVKYFGTVWKGNLLRLQLFEAARKNRELEDYDAWLDSRLRHIDEVLGWCEKYGVMAVLDLHSPPGGQAFEAGYITAKGRIFTEPAAQAKFIQVWEKMAARYKGRSVIWGFDLVNEPDDSVLGENCLDWNSLADRAARAVRAVDPDRILIIEPNQWGGPHAFAGFEPLDLPRVVYSFHFYLPMKFTHQGLFGNAPGTVYPGKIGNEMWDRAALEREMAPAIEFAKKHRVHMYVGEFSAIRSAPDGSAAAYLADVISIFEKHGWDWSYHAYREWQGWSLEHEGPLDKPVKAQAPTDREKVVTGWYGKNVSPAMHGLQNTPK